MTKRMTTVLFALAGLCWWLPAAALDADQVEGEIVEVMPDTNRLTLRVTESGDQRPERVGEVETYELEDDTVIRRDTVGVLAPANVRLTDLFPGDEVVLNFEELEGRRVARDVTVADRDAASDRDAVSERDAAAQRDQDFGADDEADIAQFETEETGAARTGAAARDRLPATASMLPLLALGGLGFAGAALLVRSRRRR
jgi:LPXTG-motif cell wall-anchored protein